MSISGHSSPVANFGNFLQHLALHFVAEGNNLKLKFAKMVHPHDEKVIMSMEDPWFQGQAQVLNGDGCRACRPVLL